jgi:large-conductance mechanosensitive channel
MNPKDITAIAIKFFGIYLMVNVVLYFPSMIMSLTALEQYQDENFNSNIFIIVVGSFILLGIIVSFILIRLANSIASKTTEPADSSPTLSQEFLLQVLGIYFIVSGLSVMPGYGISVFKTEPDTTRLLYGAGYIFQVAVGSYLLIKPVVWGQWLNKLRGRS